MKRILLLATLALLTLATTAFAAPTEPVRSAIVVPPDSASALLSGFVKDSASGETIIGATVRVRALKRGAITNKSGYYALYLPPDEDLLLEVTSLSYKKYSQRIRLSDGEKRTLNILLAPESLQGSEVVVETDRFKDRRESPQVSTVAIRPQEVAGLPKAGEADIFRILQLMPGVQTVSEISAGLYIRGGSPDQNLILLDGSTLYNPNHFFGFFSTFNPDAIKDVELIKGGFPAQYGGRLSAVLSVTNNDGDLYNTHGTAYLGLISSRASIETPVGNGAMTFSARRTYLDAILGATGLRESLDLPNYYFYDLNGKFVQSLGDNDKIAVSGYGGLDKLYYDNGAQASQVDIRWGNQSGSINWTHLFSADLFTKFNFTGSHYFSLLKFGLGASSFSFDNQIYDYSLHGDLEYISSASNVLKTGIQLSKYNFLLKISAGDNPPNANIDQRPWYYAGYVSDEWKATDRLALTPGLRVDGISTRNDVGIDPRISARYIVNPDLTIKGSYGIYHQYLDLASNPLFSAFDLWMPVDSTQAPQRAEQYVLGFSTVPFEDFTLEVETYYKNMTNLVELKPNIITGSKLSDVFFVGNGWSYGFEIFLQKQIGDWTGWIGYSLAYTRRKFPAIDNNAPFAPTYDRRNDLNIVGSYHINDRWTVGATFVYATGQPYSQTTALYEAYEPDYGGKLIPISGSKNGLRLEPYHRLDLSATYSFGFFSDKKNAQFDIDIYNVYNHRNVWFRRINTDTDPATSEDVRLLPILPTFGLTVKF
ncbi:MAG: TonB-dependent receptor [Bacteroidetes bacterium]|nr:TonB-dependent receptor [Bacteroidota bacterium]